MVGIIPRKFSAQGNRVRRLAKEGSWIIIGQVTSVAGMLVLVRVLTEYLSPEEYGQLALGITLAGLVNQVVMGGVGAGIGRFYSIAAEKQDLGGYLHATRRLLTYATLAVVVIGLILILSLYGLGHSQWVGLAVAALLFAILSGYNSTLNGIQNGARQRSIVAFHGGLDAWFKTLLAVCLILWLGASSMAVVTGYACSSLLVTVSQLIFLRRTIPPQQEPIQYQQPWLPQIWAYSVPFSIFGIFTWMQQASDRWALQTFATSSEVGQYAVLFQLGFTPIALITGMATSFLGPILYQRAGDATNQARSDNVHQLSWRITKLSLIITLLGFAITFTLHEQLFNILVATEYRSSSYLLPWVVLAGGIFASGQMLALKLMSEMKASAMTTAKIATALTGVLLNVLGAMHAGVHGVIGAVIVFSGMYFIWMTLLASRVAVKA
jgi:O-antigen/teichoic acid export membrane protein